MSRARVEKVAEDPAAAQRLLDRARDHLSSAAAEGVDAESAYSLCYQGALKAMLALLQAGGRRVGAGAGSHVLLAQEAARLLPSISSELQRIDAMRRMRHRVVYWVEEVSAAELEGALADSRAVVDAVQASIAKKERE